jgi:hypothetical protein
MMTCMLSTPNFLLCKMTDAHASHIIAEQGTIKAQNTKNTKKLGQLNIVRLTKLNYLVLTLPYKSSSLGDPLA